MPTLIFTKEDSYYFDGKATIACGSGIFTKEEKREVNLGGTRESYYFKRKTWSVCIIAWFNNNSKTALSFKIDYYCGIIDLLYLMFRIFKLHSIRLIFNKDNVYSDGIHLTAASNEVVYSFSKSSPIF